MVKLSDGHGHIECYEFESIYDLLKEAIVGGKVFRSPLTRQPYTTADRLEIERIRIIYVAADPTRAAKFPSLENLPPGVSSVNDAHEAIRQIAENVPGGEARLERILASGLIDNTSTNEERENLLFAAINYKLPALIERFKPGGDFITKTRHYTPFLLACEMGEFSIIKMVAPDPKDREAVNALLGQEEAPAPIVVAGVQRNHEKTPEILAWLFETYKYDIECTNSAGATPLIVAVDNGNIPAARYLLEKGANVNALAKTNESALKLAAYNGQIEMIDILLAHGAKMYYSDKNQTSAVSNAERRMASTKNNNIKRRYATIIERLRPIPVVHITGEDRPAEFIQRAPGAIAAQQAAIAAGRQRAIAAILAAERAEQEAAKTVAAKTVAAVAVPKQPAKAVAAAAPRQPAGTVAKTVAAARVPVSRAVAAPVISMRERQRQQEEQAAARRAAAAARSGQTVAVKTVQVGLARTRRGSRRRHTRRGSRRSHTRRGSRGSRRSIRHRR